VEVEQDEVDRPRGEDLERLGRPVRDARDREARHALDVRGVHLGDERIVLDHQRADHGAATRSPERTGSSTVRTAPSSFAARTLPPRRAAVERTSARPSPRRPAPVPGFVDQPGRTRTPARPPGSPGRHRAL
jgi:hypothetical protein